MHRARDHIRAALIVAHLAAITVAAVPTPAGYLGEERLDDEEVRASLAPWAGLVARLGLADDVDGGYRWLWGAGRVMVDARRAAMEHVSPYLKFTGNAQSWKMFGVVPTRYARLEVHGRATDGPWEPLYVERQGPDWGWVLLDHGRIRAMRSGFAAREGRGRYEQLAALVGRRALAEHPRLQAVRVRFQAVTVPPAARLRADGGLTEGRTFWTVEIPRESGP
jgi:hypothetical protein